PTKPATVPTPAHTTAAPQPKQSTEAPAPTQPAAGGGGTCAAHTVGSCGWDHGITPAHAGETAQCVDGTASDSAHFEGTCSQHHGVRYWFK
ncbi:DUF3761 domain-containing protein, partial [Kitasatospora nipponensis]|uniref:DUF3761 domain-containing protein n=1 Tax=Kitasatospora nipponensis TaxID=258049 RepID=UPI003CD0ACD6